MEIPAPSPHSPVGRIEWPLFPGLGDFLDAAFQVIRQTHSPDMQGFGVFAAPEGLFP